MFRSIVPKPLHIFHSRLTIVFLLSFTYCLFFSSCSVNNARIDNSLKNYFDSNKVDGAFTLLNNSDNSVTVYNMALDTQRFSPASTFEIVNTLTGLEVGTITNDTMKIKWDGKPHFYPGGDTAVLWNRDLGMTEAFKANATLYFQEVARRSGKDTLKRWIDSIGYGNKNINGPVDSFWLNNTLKISADEQLGLLKRLYFDQLPFRKSSQQIVRDIMLQEDNTAYRLSYKTGRGLDENGHDIGWLEGWIEENKHIYFFVTFVKAGEKNIDIEKVRLNITKGILKQYGFFEGKK